MVWRTLADLLALCRTDEILRLCEVAQLLKVAKKAVYTMIWKGGPPMLKVRRQWRFRRTNLDFSIDAPAGEEKSE